MPKYGFAAGPRHRRDWLQTRPRPVVAAVCTLWAVPMLLLWINLTPDDPPPPETVLPVDVGVGAPPAAGPAASAVAGRSPAGGPDPGPTAATAGAIPPGADPTGVGPGRRPEPTQTVGGPASRPPPSNVRDPDPGGPLLAVSRAEAPSSVDLSVEGTRDWIHWGLRAPGSTNRKAGGTQAISDDGGTGPRERNDAGAQRFSWRNGAPERSVANATTGVYAVGLDSGFRLSVAAGAQTRTLRLYAGVMRSQGRLEVSLPGAGLTRTTTVASAAKFGSLRNRFTITFRAPAGGRLQIRWIVTKIYNQYGADVSLQAATLQ